jgi:hypothetical protein
MASFDTYQDFEEVHDRIDDLEERLGLRNDLPSREECAKPLPIEFQATLREAHRETWNRLYRQGGQKEGYSYHRCPMAIAIGEHHGVNFRGLPQGRQRAFCRRTCPIDWGRQLPCPVSGSTYWDWYRNRSPYSTVAAKIRDMPFKEDEK